MSLHSHRVWLSREPRQQRKQARHHSTPHCSYRVTLGRATHFSASPSFTRPIKSTTTPSDRPTPAPFGQATSISKPITSHTLHPLPQSPPPTMTAPSTPSKHFKLHLRQSPPSQLPLHELTLIDRIWYKNASQFKSALWWGGFDSVTTLFAPRFASLFSRCDLALSVVSDLTLLYARLGGAEIQPGHNSVNVDPPPQYQSSPPTDAHDTSKLTSPLPSTSNIPLNNWKLFKQPSSRSALDVHRRSNALAAPQHSTCTNLRSVGYGVDRLASLE